MECHILERSCLFWWNVFILNLKKINVRTKDCVVGLEGIEDYGSCHGKA